jgi:hypothetical protein
MRGTISLANQPQVAKKQEQPMKNYNTSDFQAQITKSANIQIIVPQLSVDGIASAAALGLALKKHGKTVSIFCPQKPDANYNKLAGLDMLSEPVLNQDLTITLDYPLDQIEKVSYNDDGGKLNLVVQTKPGASKVESSQIAVNNQSGGSVSDLNILFGDPAPLADKSVLQKSTVIQITSVDTPSFVPASKIFDPDAPFSEILTFLIPMLGLELDPEASKNLLIALRVSTQSFAVNVSPESFEAGAICLRASQLGMEQPPAINTTPIEAVEVKPGQTKPNPTGMN